MSLARLAMAGALALAAAGCSADITRFDQPSFAFNDSSSNITSPGAASPGASPRVPTGVDVIDSQPPASPPAPYRQPSSAQPFVPVPATVSSQARTQRPVVTASVPAQPSSQGDVVEVQSGDSIYAIAHRHHVSVADLMSANDLKTQIIKPGQKLRLPTAGAQPPREARMPAAVAAQMPAVPAAPVTHVASAQPVAPRPAANGDWSGSYTVKPGDSVYAIASRLGVKADELQRANGITDPRRIKPGVELKVPATGSATASATKFAAQPVSAPYAAAPIVTAQAPTPVAGAAPLATQTTSSSPDFKIINGPSDTAPVEPIKVVAKPQPMATAEPAEPAGLAAGKAVVSSKLRWPVQGRIVQGFGPGQNGDKNDGVDLAVPLGTEVLAAEAGTVAYAGNEVASYGNLVLIRHDNGLVTAYANNDKLLVQHGDRVKRGQPIAKAGKTGDVEQPQLHFEVRVGSKPVDPMPYLEKL